MVGLEVLEARDRLSSSRSRDALRASVRIGALALVLLLALVVGTLVGALADPPTAVLRAVVDPRTHPDLGRALWMLRIPRVLLGALVGGTLAVAGALLQGMLRNPLVDPYLTGTSAGATCAVALALAFGVAAPFVPLVAFGAALVTAAFVAALARTGSGISAERLILAGISTSALFAAVVTMTLLLVPSLGASLGILAWLGGTLAGRGWPELRWAALYAALGMALALAIAPALNALRLGERRARALGIDVDRAGWLIVAAAALLTGAAVSVSGLVGFVGLIVPHVARRLVGGDARWLLPASALAGAATVVVADAIARSAAPPLELPLGVLLSLLGVPAFLYLAFRRGRAGLVAGAAS